MPEWAPEAPAIRSMSWTRWLSQTRVLSRQARGAGRLTTVLLLTSLQTTATPPGLECRAKCQLDLNVGNQRHARARGNH